MSISLLSELCITMSEGKYATFVSVAMPPLSSGGWGTERGILAVVEALGGTLALTLRGLMVVFMSVL